MGALLVLCLCLPAASLAAGGSSGGATMDGRSSGELLSVGVGYGSQGGSQAVRELQVRLRTVGYEPGPIDGLFGPLTRGAVRSFQRAHGLASDGVVGPRTDAALRRAGIPAGSASVRVIQRQLRALGYETGPIDGVYGARTEAAVERFQAAEGLAVNGVPGAQTAARLKAQRAALIPEPAKRAAGPVPGATARSALGAARPERPRPDTSSGAGPTRLPGSPARLPGPPGSPRARTGADRRQGDTAPGANAGARAGARGDAPGRRRVQPRSRLRGVARRPRCGRSRWRALRDSSFPDDGAASTAKSLLGRAGLSSLSGWGHFARGPRRPICDDPAWRRWRRSSTVCGSTRITSCSATSTGQGRSTATLRGGRPGAGRSS